MMENLLGIHWRQERGIRHTYDHSDHNGSRDTRNGERNARENTERTSRATPFFSIRRRPTVAMSLMGTFDFLMGHRREGGERGAMMHQTGMWLRRFLLSLVIDREADMQAGWVENPNKRH